MGAALAVAGVVAIEDLELRVRTRDGAQELWRGIGAAIVDREYPEFDPEPAQGRQPLGEDLRHRRLFVEDRYHDTEALPGILRHRGCYRAWRPLAGPPAAGPAGTRWRSTHQPKRTRSQSAWALQATASAEGGSGPKRLPA